jgi:hypothetical protein
VSGAGFVEAILLLHCHLHCAAHLLENCPVEAHIFVSEQLKELNLSGAPLLHLMAELFPD